MESKETLITDGSCHGDKQKDVPMPVSRKMRNLKVSLSDDELQTLQLATTMSAYDTQSDFVASTLLAAAEEEINKWRYTTTDLEP